MTPIDWKPDATKLRQFGFIAIAGFGLIGLVIYLKLFRGLGYSWADNLAFAVWVLAVLCPILSLTKPNALRPIFIGMSAFGMVIGFIISNVLLAILFYAVFTPIALFFKLTGRDVLQRKIDQNCKTYWLDRGSERAPADYYRQF